jgi:1-deoxy-D-xylulose-5-phosphate synthase
MFQFALDQTALTVAIRYPKANLPSLPQSGDPVIRMGKAEVVRQGEGIVLHAYGSMVVEACRAADILAGEGLSVTVVNARFAKPLDEEILKKLSLDHHTLVTIEEHALAGGFGSAVLEVVADRGISFSRVIRFGIPDSFQTFGARERLLADCGLDARGIADRVLGLGPVASRASRAAVLASQGGDTR